MKINNHNTSNKIKNYKSDAIRRKKTKVRSRTNTYDLKINISHSEPLNEKERVLISRGTPRKRGGDLQQVPSNKKEKKMKTKNSVTLQIPRKWKREKERQTCKKKH